MPGGKWNSATGAILGGPAAHEKNNHNRGDNNMKKATLTLTACLLAGCVTVPKVYEAVDGSRADGKVTMGYEIAGAQIAKVDESQAYEEALRRCRNWGYADAEGFAEMKTITGRDPIWGTLQYRVTREFQCVSAE